MAMQTQLQIRQNAHEVQEYMKDLFDWQKTIKSKDAVLKQQDQPAPAPSEAASTSGGLPAPRGRALGTAVGAAPAELQKPGLVRGTQASASKPAGSGKPASSSKRKKKAAGGDSASNAAAHTYTSYSKWDKLDVDAMLDSSGSEAEEEEDEEEPRQHQQLASTAGTSTGPVVPNQTPGSNAATTIVPAPRQPAAVPAPNPGPAPAAGPSASKPASTQASAAAAASMPQHPPVRNSEPQTADAWRTRGNDLFKAGQYAYAKECYTRCIELDPSSAAAFANRAMAELKLGEWAAAEQDCTEALKLDPAYIKALHRRGTARKQQGSLLAAASDFEEALRLEPGNKAVAADREAALSAHLSAARIAPLSKRTRLDITLAAAPPVAAPAPAPAAAPPTAAPAAAGSGPSSAPKKPAPISAAPATAAAAAASSNGASGIGSASVSASPGPSSPSSAASASASGSSSSKARIAAAAQSAAEQLAARLATNAKAPKTSTEFEATWRGLRGDVGAQASYLALLEPHQLPTVFKSSLTPQVLSAILRTLLSALAGSLGPGSAAEGQGEGVDAAGQQQQQGLSGAAALGLLSGLSKVPRLEMAAMCIPSKERAELGAMWEAGMASAQQTGAASGAEVGEVSKLKTKFKL